MKKYFILSIVVLFILPSHVRAYDNEISHRDITEQSVKIAGDEYNLEIYLIENLGLNNGFENLLGEKTIIEWIKKGAIDEDVPPCRASNHFHNPLKLWSNSGMSDAPWWTEVTCSFWKPWYSNVAWATSFLSPDGTRALFSDPARSPYNWDTTRDHFYKALTASSEEMRTVNYIDTFLDIGHVMHLLEDMSVPAHVRNDFTSHLIDNGFWRIQPYEHYVQNHPTLVFTAQVQPDDFPSTDKLTGFWDSNIYRNLVAYPSLSNVLGLAETTNANYFSNFTIRSNNPSPEHDFPYPIINSFDYQICEDFVSGSTDKRKYVSRKSKGGCSSPDHFATISLLNEEYLINDSSISTLQLWLDDNVHNTYAKELLPRAVGYSAGLLNYFFRGQIDMEPDPDNPGMYVIENLSDEPMEGTFELYYDDASGNRHPVEGASWDLEIKAKDKSAPISFTPPTNPAPKDKGKYMLVFQGTLGNEQGAVVGKIIKPTYAIAYIGYDAEWSYLLNVKDSNGASGEISLQAYDVLHPIALRFDVSDSRRLAILWMDSRVKAYKVSQYVLDAIGDRIVITEDTATDHDLSALETKGNFQLLNTYSYPHYYENIYGHDNNEFGLYSRLSRYARYTDLYLDGGQVSLFGFWWETSDYLYQAKRVVIETSCVEYSGALKPNYWQNKTTCRPRHEIDLVNIETGEASVTSSANCTTETGNWYWPGTPGDCSPRPLHPFISHSSPGTPYIVPREQKSFISKVGYIIDGRPGPELFNISFPPVERYNEPNPKTYADNVTNVTTTLGSRNDHLLYRLIFHPLRVYVDHIKDPSTNELYIDMFYDFDYDIWYYYYYHNVRDQWPTRSSIFKLSNYFRTPSVLALNPAKAMGAYTANIAGLKNVVFTSDGMPASAQNRVAEYGQIKSITRKGQDHVFSVGGDSWSSAITGGHKLFNVDRNTSYLIPDDRLYVNIRGGYYGSGKNVRLYDGDPTAGAPLKYQFADIDWEGSHIDWNIPLLDVSVDMW